MTDRIPLKAVFTGSEPTALGEFTAGDTIPFEHLSGVAAAGHDHSGVYEPADSTILRDADIGTTVQAYDADIPTVAASQAEMEAGTETALRSMSPLRVAQAVAALTPSGAFPFYKANGGSDPISLTSDNKLPFYVAAGTTSNIPLVI
jgi:hypothetical protein